ncbi:hypothetical protein [Paenibacillus sp. FSL R10-2734]|uniref:hypothetical protein n=1 Tax=Paenibacillus sp. FSL R10-2734 TaxID=2954691 RepID=UPI0030D757A3
MSVIIVVLFFLLPPLSYKIDIRYSGAAYQENTPEYSTSINVKLKGDFDRKAKEFRGNVSINSVDYNNCRIGPSSGFLCDSPDSSLQFFGMSYSNNKFDEITLIITDSPLYSKLTGHGYTEDLIISIPSVDRSSSLNLSEKLKNSYFDNK